MYKKITSFIYTKYNNIINKLYITKTTKLLFSIPLVVIILPYIIFSSIRGKPETVNIKIEKIKIIEPYVDNNQKWDYLNYLSKDKNIVEPKPTTQDYKNSLLQELTQEQEKDLNLQKMKNYSDYNALLCEVFIDEDNLQKTVKYLKSKKIPITIKRLNDVKYLFIGPSSSRDELNKGLQQLGMPCKRVLL